MQSVNLKNHLANSVSLFTYALGTQKINRLTSLQYTSLEIPTSKNHMSSLERGVKII